MEKFRLATVAAQPSTITRAVRSLRPLDLIALVFVAVIVGQVGYTIFLVSSSARRTTSIATAQSELAVDYAGVIAELSAYLGVTRTLAGFTFGSHLSSPFQSTDIDEAKFATLCSEEVERLPALLSLQIRPGGTLTYIYPNGSAPIGLNLTAGRPAEYEATITAREGFIAGPRMLAQGFPGLVTYWAIWTNGTTPSRANGSALWGNVGVVINLQRFSEQIALSGTNAINTSGGNGTASLSRRSFLVHMINEVTKAEAYLGSWPVNTSVYSSVDQILAARENNLRVVLSRSRSLQGVRVTAVLEVDLVDATPEEIGSILGVILALVAIVAVVFAFVLRSRVLLTLTKDINNAPSNGERVVILFSDVVNSTQKWDACPNIMAEAIRVHHRMAREAIATHGAYEVKSMGDGMMVACNDVDKAVLLANDFHKRLSEASWPILSTISARERMQLISQQQNALVLQVRIGIHVGRAQMAFDEVSKAPDFYGPMVNMAARLEKMAPPGATLVSSDLADAISDDLRADLLMEQMPTKVLFKGIATPQTVYVIAADVDVFSRVHPKEDATQELDPQEAH